MGSDVRLTLTVSHLSTIAQLLAHFSSKLLLEFTLNNIVPSPAAPMGPLDSKMYLSLILILFFIRTISGSNSTTNIGQKSNGTLIFKI